MRADTAGTAFRLASALMLCVYGKGRSSQNSGLSDARRQAASLSPSAACRQAGAASHGGDEAAFAKGAGKFLIRRRRAPWRAMERRPPAAWKAASWGARSGSKVTRSGGEGAEGSRAEPLTRLIRRTKADWKVSQADFRLGNPRHGATRCRATKALRAAPCVKIRSYT